MLDKLLDKVLGERQPVSHGLIVCTDCGFRRCRCVERCPGKCRSKEYVLESSLGKPTGKILDTYYWPLPLDTPE